MVSGYRKSPIRSTARTEAPPFRGCDVPECRACGEFRAPKSRENLNDYYWFCLDHVRSYNRAWDYYKGMTTAEIEAQIRHDTTWRRPRWDFKNKQRTINPKLVDEFGFFDFADNPEEEAEAKARFQEKTATDDVWDTAALKALKVLGLKPPVTRDFLKQHYKALVKRHHPDANGGDREAEEQLKAINQAYGFLRSRQFA